MDLLKRNRHAFPGHISASTTPGMTTRQYIAAHAPITFLDAATYLDVTESKNKTYDATINMLAQMRIHYADEMIKLMASKQTPECD